MRKLVIVIAAVAVIAVAIAVYFVATRPAAGSPVRFPLSTAQRQLLAQVPADAGAFALIPSAAAVHRKLLDNPVTHDPVAAWTAKEPLPRAWMIGAADLAVWRSGNQTGYAVRLDPLRALLVRAWLMIGSSGFDARSSNGVFLINAPSVETLAAQDLDHILALAQDLPTADALVVQVDRSRGAYPPIGRPAVTAVQLSRREIVLISRSMHEADEHEVIAATPFRPRFPDGPMLSAAFAGAPRVIGDLDRIFGAHVSHLLDQGGMMVLYDIDSRRLLPRPNGLFVVPANQANRDAVRNISGAVDVVGETAESNGSILIGFDRQSVPAYERERFVDARSPASDWAIRLDPKRAVPVIDDLGGNTALRLVTPRLYRSIRDLRGWVQYLGAADSVEAEHLVRGDVEELTTRIDVAK